MNLDIQTYFPGVNIQKSMTHSLVRGKFCDIVSGKATRLKFFENEKLSLCLKIPEIDLFGNIFLHYK